MATVKSDDNTPSDHDRSESSSEVDPTLGKRQKLEEAESKKEESQGFNDEKESNPVVELTDEESDEKLDDEKESNPIVELDDEKESNPIVVLDDDELDDEKESNPIVELDDEKEINPIVELDDDDKKESIPIVQLDEESDEDLDDEDVELTYQMRSEEELIIEDRQMQLAEAEEQGHEEASTSSEPLPMLFIHHSEGDFFQQRAQEAKKALEDRIPGIYVYVKSRQNYRLGIFYIRSEEEVEFVGLRMKPPFTALAELDMDDIADIISVLIRN